jgi:hypothetical protein
MGNSAFIVWKGHGGDKQIYAAVQRSGSTFNPATKVGYFATSRGIAAVSYPDGVVAAWRGADDDNRIWVSRAIFDGSNWSDQFLPRGAPRTEDRPALANWGGRVLMAWRGAAPDQTIWFSELTAGGWTEQQAAINGAATSSHGPALAAHGGELVMAWKGAGDDQGLYWARYDGATWNGPHGFAGGTTHGPALASQRTGVVMAWKGSGDDSRLWRASFDGGWTQQALAVGRSSHGPALGTVGDHAVMAWKGVAGDEALWWTRNFTAQEPVAPGYTSSDTPAITSVDIHNL